MKVEFERVFIKLFRKRLGHSPQIKKRFEERLHMFRQNPANPLLSDHALKGAKLGQRAFSITGDIRVIYVIHGEVAYFFDIGTHNQVYK